VKAGHTPFQSLHLMFSQNLCLFLHTHHQCFLIHWWSSGFSYHPLHLKLHNMASITYIKLKKKHDHKKILHEVLVFSIWI
jgi:hypothetical protein